MPPNMNALSPTLNSDIMITIDDQPRKVPRISVQKVELFSPADPLLGHKSSSQFRSHSSIDMQNFFLPPDMLEDREDPHFLR